MSVHTAAENSNQLVTIDELYLAYRKAKVDLYYSSYKRIHDLSRWERDLDKNLRNLQSKINGKDLSNDFGERKFVGGVTYLPKSLTSFTSQNGSIEEPNPTLGSEKVGDSGLINLGVESQSEDPTPKGSHLTFRLLENCSIGFHVLSALWVAKVGEKLEKRRSSHLYSNHVRRSRNGDYNAAALGTFVPYIHGYRRWRDGAVKAADQLVTEDNESAIVFQADISNFYYRIDPKFLDSPAMGELIESLELNEAEKRVHECFKISLEAWSYDNFEKLAKENQLDTEAEAKHIGLPGGLSASPILSNLVLEEFDENVDAQINPTFYGRYVDDIVIVLRQSKAMKDITSLRKWITARIRNFTYENTEANGGFFKLCPSILEDTSTPELRFENRKNRVLLLGGTPGAMSLELLRQQMAQTSSEWRLMPTLPDPPKALIGEIATNGGTNNLIPHLGLLEEVTVHKNNLSRVLRDFEFYSRNSDAVSWRDYRTELYQIARSSFFKWNNIAEYSVYIPRILRLALICGDYDDAASLLQFIRGQLETLQVCDVKVSGFAAKNSVAIFEGWKNSLFLEIKSLIYAISPLKIGVAQRLNLFDALTSIQNEARQPRAGAPLRERSEASYAAKFEIEFTTLFLQDLALEPFRDCLAPSRTFRVDIHQLTQFFKDVFLRRHNSFENMIVNWHELDFQSLSSFVKGIRGFVEALQKEHQIFVCEMYSERPEIFGSLMFPTRAPYSSQIMTWTSQFAAKDIDLPEDEIACFNQLVEWVSAIRGYNLAGFVESDRGRFKFANGKMQVCNPKVDVSQGAIRIAVVSLETKRGDLELAAWGKHRMDKARLEQFTSLVNSILRVRDNVPKYVLFPELSIPPVWFEELAYSLAKRGINLIGGVEYQQSGSSSVCNQVWASLIDYSFGFPIFSIYRQDKQSPAVGEARNLSAIKGLSLLPENHFPETSTGPCPPIIQHGNFRFSILVCSELTNIHYKASLRGKIDCLFVVEWNRDINTFNDLVNAAGWDIHSYVVQSNNRQYGDSRIRAPYKEQYRRDIVRIRGGLHDHFVVGSIDVKGLRAFQSKTSSLSNVFKPTPDGFSEDMDGSRIAIPESKR